jgi:riboflavin transporter FmnP
MVQDSKSSGLPALGKVSKSKTIAATGLFAALSIIFTALSQFAGLNFPIVPYLQFDFGEVAILLAFFAFGPVPAVASAFVEFVTLMALGQNVPIGPVFKLFAILSTLAGLWLGVTVVRKTIPLARRSLTLGTSLGLGLILRAVVMTAANYYLIVYFYTVPTIVGFVTASFKLVGITLTSTNALGVILTFTAIFNCLQLALVFAISYLFFRLPQLRNILRANRIAWFESLGTKSHSKN